MTTAEVVEALYDAFFAGDPDGMLALMDEDVEVRFLGQAALRGREEVARFLAFAGGLLTDVDFRREHVIIDGDRAACLWSETATTATGKPWRNHGVDVIHVGEGRIFALHENNDVRLVHEHLPRYEPAKGQP